MITVSKNGAVYQMEVVGPPNPHGVAFTHLYRNGEYLGAAILYPNGQVSPYESGEIIDDEIYEDLGKLACGGKL